VFLLSSHDEQIKLKSTFYSPKTRTLRGLKGAQTANEQKHYKITGLYKINKLREQFFFFFFFFFVFVSFSYSFF
jgi:hypothetical protein